MAEKYTEGEKMLLASFVIMEVLGLQAENEMRKANGNDPKYGEKEFYKTVNWAHDRLRDYY